MHRIRTTRYVTFLLLFWLANNAFAYEIGTQYNTGTAQIRGQSFVPSQASRSPLGVPFPTGFEPSDLAGQSYLYEVELLFADAALAPGEIFLFSSLPSPAASVSGDGALATAQFGSGCSGSRCKYFFQNTVALNYDDTYFLVFPSCAALITGNNSGADDYPAGDSIVSPDCSAPGRSALSISRAREDAAFIARFFNASPNPVADFRAGNQGLSSVSGAPALVGQDFTQVTVETVLGQDSPAHPMDGALMLDTLSLAASNAYSVAMLLRVDETAQFRKLLDVSDRQSDTGLYVVNNLLNFFDQVSAPNQDFPPDTWLQVLLQRDPFGLVRVSINDTQQFFFDDFDTRVATLSPAQRMTFFADDFVTAPAENPGGAWARIRLFDNAGASLSGLSAFPDEGADRFENDNGPFRADLGLNGTAGRFRTLHSNEDEDWLYAGVACQTDNNWNIADVLGNLVLYSDDPRFQPLVEFYPQTALADPNTPPSFTAGACGQQQRLLMPAPNDTFIRIRNCPDVPISVTDAINYRVENLSRDLRVCAAAVLIQGTVTDSSSGDPVGGVYILGDGNSAGFSNPADGTYRILVTDFTQMTLGIVSPFWEAPTQTVDEILDNVMAGGTLTVDFQVTRKGTLFKDSLEETNPFQLP